MKANRNDFDNNYFNAIEVIDKVLFWLGITTVTIVFIGLFYITISN